MTNDQLKAALANGNVQAMLRTIRVGEGTSDEDGYRRIVGGALFDSFADHPRQAVKTKYGWTSAAGAYQFMCKVPGKVTTDTWTECRDALNLPDFSPESQDLAAAFLINRRKALDDVIAGRIPQAIGKLNREWASLPGSPYGQPTVTLAKALSAYSGYGGQLHENDAKVPETIITHKEAPVAPFIAAALPALIKSAPALIRIFGDSPQAEKNAKAAEVVASIAKDATGSKNLQEAVETIQSDPEAAQGFRAAVQDRWFELQEVGGGVVEARKADLEFSKGDILHSPSFWIALGLLPLVYMIVANVVGLIGAPLSDEVRSAISNGVVGLVLGGLIGYYYGQTTSRNRA